MNQRLRNYGIIPGQLPTGPLNLLSDVDGVTVGHFTAPGPNRTGLTIISPSRRNVFRHKLPAAVSVGNGFGKMTGTTQIVEFGTLETPIGLTSTHAVGPVMDGIVKLVTAATPDIMPYESINAVVGETNDWILNDLHTATLEGADVAKAWSARTKRFALGATGAGAGTRAFSWKGGIGSASRRLSINGLPFTAGALVQTNFGGDFTMLGVPIGRLLGASPSYTFSGQPEPDGSCMIVLATDAPLSSRQLGRLARRAFIGLARTGSVMAATSGDYAIAFSTTSAKSQHEPISDYELNNFFIAVAECVEESIYDAMLTATTTTGRDGNALSELPADQAIALLKEHLP